MRNWPVVKLTRPPKSDHLRFAPSTPPPGYERASALFTETYVPVSAANVLSAEEARALVKGRDYVLDEDGFKRIDKILDRLSDWAGEER
jgi:hypothetical protein